MGHARAYLTFDILRRIMADYLHYDVQYHINITDVDDKIILRARRNHLVKQYLESKPKVEEVRSKASGSLLSEHLKLESKLADADMELKSMESSPDGKRQAEMIEQKKQLEYKLAGVIKTMETLAALGSGVTVDEIAKIASDALGTSLDAEFGSTITDNAVFDAHARKYEKSFMEDMERLGVRPPDVLTRVTEYVPEIVQYCETLVTKGFAYASNGSVYLDTKAFEKADHTYRKLKPFSGETSKEELEESEGALGCMDASEKRDPKRDFVLWKKSKPGEPFWDSPWGTGRPGWHIECSVVASDVLGSRLDVHAGGEDLKFPHHDNELAQSEAYHECNQWVNYFFHAGHLQIKGLKMSKSLKNFVTIQEALQISNARRLRLLFLIQPWDGSFTYSDESLEMAQYKEKRFQEFLGLIDQYDRDLVRVFLEQAINCPSEHERRFAQVLSQEREKAHAAILNNFDTTACLGNLENIVDAFYEYKIQAKQTLAYPVCLEAGRYVKKILSVFGVEFTTGSGEENAVLETLIEDVVSFREEMKQIALGASPEIKLKLIKACDYLRDETLVERGVALKDEGTKSTWSRRDAKELQQEVAEKRAKAAREALEKQQRKVEKAADDLKKIQVVLNDGNGSDIFRPGKSADQHFLEFDANGMPVKDAKGETISKSLQKKLDKQLDDAKRKWDELEKKATQGGFTTREAFVESKVKELEALQRGEDVGVVKKVVNGTVEAAAPAAGPSSFFTVGSDKFETFVVTLKGKEFPDLDAYYKFWKQ